MMDPRLVQQIRISPASNAQHIVRSAGYTQVMTASSTHAHNEANNNILARNNMDGDLPREDLLPGDSELYGNFNDTQTLSQWTSDQMYWSGEIPELAHQNSASIMSFQSNLTDSSASFHSQISEHSESKEEEICLILNKVRSQNKVEASKILLALSTSVDNCVSMRHCGCLPLLVDLLHCPDENSNTYHMADAQRIRFEVRERASQVLHNIVFSQPDDRKSRREARVLRLLEQIRDYCDQLRNSDDNRNAQSVEQQLGSSVASLMKLSFDEDHRHAMCQLGGLQAIAELLQIEQEVHGCTNDPFCITIRRYAGMVLTNLTFGDGANKALLCSMRPFMEALSAQLYSPSEDLRQVTASVLRNLSWRADPASKRTLRSIGAVTMLVKAAMEAEKEPTLKSILSALWNLSAHCSGNKADICHVDGALAFLVSTLTYKSKAKTLAIVENGGGILRNVSSHIAIQNDYRVILRKHNCLQILLQHLKSPSLTVVSNACGTLWNLSARNAVDQRSLWEMGAVGMLKKLINSKHKMISMGSSAALKNLLSAKPPGVGVELCVFGENYKSSDDAPSLMVRKQKALNTEIDQNLTETYEITDSPKTSPVKVVNNDKRSRRHISPSARYMTNQKIRNELSLPSRAQNTDNMQSSIVVEEKHNGAFQVTKNAKQAMSYRQSQIKFQQEAKENSELTAVDRKSVESGYESSRMRSAPAKNNQHSFSSVDHDRSRSDTRNSSVPCSSRNEIQTPERNFQPSNSLKGTVPERSGSLKEPGEKTVNQQLQQKPLIESKIPLPKSFNPQRSQSSSPVAQRRTSSQRQPNNSQVANNKVVDITVTHPKYAWNSSSEKQDNDPEKPVHFAKCLGTAEDCARENIPVAESVKPYISQPPEIEDGNCSEDKVCKMESTPSNFSSMNDMEDITNVGARCSLNIKTSTNVRMIRQHPLLANVSAYRGEDDNGRLFEPRYGSKQNHFGEIEEGKTVDFSVQSDYDIEETLSMMSRSSSMASISSFDQQSFHEDESFASDISHRTSGIESPCELSDSPCETAPSSPVKQLALCSGSSDDMQIMSSGMKEGVSGDLGSNPANVQLSSYDDEDRELLKTDQSVQIAEDAKPDVESSFNICAVPVEKELPRTGKIHDSNSSNCASNEDGSPSDTLLSVDSIRINSQHCPGARQKVHQSNSQVVERHPNLNGYDAGRSKLKSLEIKEIECDSYSDNEEKGKEDERKAEKTRLFRIPESPIDKKQKAIEDSNKINYVRDDKLAIEEKSIVKAIVDQKGNRRFESKTSLESNESIPNQLSFLMNRQKNMSAECTKMRPQANRTEQDFKSPEDVSTVSRLDDFESQEISINTEDSDNSYFTCYSETRSLDKDGNTKILKSSESSEYFQISDSVSKSSKDSKPKSPEELSEKDIDCSERDDDDETMIKSSILDEAKEIAQALLGARVDSTEDMTVSTLSCLSDIDNARPPSVMAEVGCLSMNSSTASEENLKLAVTRECQKLFGAKQVKKSLLRELQIGRLTSEQGSNDNSKCSNESADNMSMKSSCASELLGNVNPPSMLDDLSLTASGGSLNCSSTECQQHLTGHFRNNHDSMSERMHDAEAMSKLYAKELSNIQGKIATEAKCFEIIPQMNLPTSQEVVEVTIADVTEIGCDTIGSDTELEDDLPCDDEDFCSETIQESPLKKEDGSVENLTLTLTEEPLHPLVSPYTDFQKQSVCFMTAEQLKALQENADMILNTLKDVEISDEETGGVSNGDMLEDETMSLVSNESDEEFLSPDGQNHQRFATQKLLSKGDGLMSPTCNGMVALPQSSAPKMSMKKSSLPQFSPRKKPGLPKPNEQIVKNKYTYPESIKKEQISYGNSTFEESSHECLIHENQTKVKTYASDVRSKLGLSTSSNLYHDPTIIDRGVETIENGAFDSRTFTKKKTVIPRNMMPSVPPSSQVPVNPSFQRGPLRSPSATNLPSLPPSPSIKDSKLDSSKTVESKIASVWKNSGKMRSKSVGDPNRSSRLQIAPSAINTTNKDGNKSAVFQRSSFEVPKSPVSRNFERAEDESVRRPSSLALGPRSHSPRHTKGFPPRPSQACEDVPEERFSIVSPTSALGSSIPRPLIAGRRSMIPTPAKLGLPEN